MDAPLHAMGFTILALALTILSLRAGFYVGKNVPYSRSLREELLRRAGIAVVYVQAFVAVLIPSYHRRLHRKRKEALEEYKRSLRPIERTFDKPRQG